MKISGMDYWNQELTGTRVSGIPSTAATKIQTTSPIFEEIMYRINCFVLLYIALPSATACSESYWQWIAKKKKTIYNL